MRFRQIILLIHYVTVISSCLHAQVTFQKTFGGDGNDMANAALEIADGYLIAGSTESFGSGLSDMYLIKTDTAGNIVWSKAFGSSDDEYAHAVKQTSDGGFILAGSKGTYPASSAGVDMYLVKTDFNGNLVWSKTIGFNSSNDQAFSVLQTADSGYVAAGVTYGTGAGAEYYMVKTDASGNLLWTHTYGMGTENDDFEDLAQTSDGGFILVGITFNDIGTVDFGAYLVKTDGSGNVQWSRAYAVAPPGNPTWGTNECRAVVIANDGNILVSTESDNVLTSGGVDILVFKMDNTGNLLWTGDAYGWQFPSFETAWDIVITSDGGSAEGGQALGTIQGESGDMLLLKRNISGVMEWAKTYGGTGQDVANTVLQTSDGGYILAGHTKSFGAGNRDIYIVKTDDSGNSSGCNEQDVILPSGTPLLTNDTVFISSSGGIAANAVTTVTYPITSDSLLCVPVAAFYEGSPDICAGNCIGFYDITSNSPTSWNWTFTGAIPAFSTDQHPSGICYDSIGTYLVQLIATNFISSDTVQKTVTVTGNNLTSITNSTPSSCGNCNGTATASPSGGSGNYLYTWSDGQSGSVASGLCPGNYTVTVQEAGAMNSVFWSEDFTGGGTGWSLNQNGPGTNGFWPNFWVINSLSLCGCGTGNYLHVSCSNTILNCVFNSGNCVYNSGTSFDPATDRIAVSPIIPTTGKTNITLKFQWISNGMAGQDFGKLRLSNDGGATWTESATSYSGTLSCGQDSIALPAIYENIPDFRIAFRWVNNGMGNGSDPPFGIDNIQLSTPSFGSACSSVDTIPVNSSSGITASVTTMDATCGNSNGEATAIPSGGVSPYTFLWNDGQSTQTATGLAAGNYWITVTDSTGCTYTTAINVSSTNSPTISTSSTGTGCTSNMGTATADATGGTPPYSYLWNDGQTTQTATGLGAGIYTVTLTDSAGCTDTSFVTVSATNSPVVSVTSTNTGCTSYTGTATADATGGTPPYSYLWNNGQTTQTATGLGAGIYTVTLTDSVGCTDTDTAIVLANNAPVLSIISTDVSCNSIADGSASAIVSGGTLPYTYSWSNGATQSQVINLAPQIYYLTVTDSSGCTVMDSASVTEPAPVYASVNGDSVICEGESTTLSASGGTSYQWNSGETGSAIIVYPTATTPYSVIAFVGICSDSAIITVTVFPAPVVDAGPDVTIFSGTDTTLMATGSNGNYSWKPTGSLSCTVCQSPVVSPETTETFSVTLTDNNGCTSTDSVKVTIDENCGEVFVPNIFSPNNDGNNDVFYVRGKCIEKMQWVIYNRWGAKVFESDSPQNGWDGSYKGKNLDAAVFVWHLKYKLSIDTEEKTMKGNITLVK